MKKEAFMVAELTIFPLGKVRGLSADIARVVALVEKSGLPYQLTSMGTILEGEWEEVIRLLGECRRALLKDNERIYMVLKIDDDRGKTGKLKGKVRSVEEKLGHPVRK
jgi:uncharacterized protein (TIGR00106 family)